MRFPRDGRPEEWEKVDLTLIRLAVYEMKYEDDIPVKVAINEAVELCKTVWNG